VAGASDASSIEGNKLPEVTLSIVASLEQDIEIDLNILIPLQQVAMMDKRCHNF
jgi:hypothetical protein